MMIRIILAVAIIAAVIDAGVFLSDYFNQSFAAQALNSQIESENLNLVQLSGKTQELNAQITNHSASVERVMAVIDSQSGLIPQAEISPNEIIGSLLKLGQQYQVSIIPLTTQDWSSLTNAQYNCRILKMSLDVMGAKEQVVQTIRQLPQLYNTLVIENISLSKVVVDTAAEATPAPDSNQITAKLNLAFYAK